MCVEAVWYEASPYLYLAVGLGSLLFCTSTLGFLFSAILVAVAVALLSARRVYRSPERQHRRKYARPTGEHGVWPFGRI